MIEVEHGLVIERPVGEVFALVTNVGDNPRWQSGVLQARKTSQGPMGVGSTGIELRKFLGRRMKFTFAVTEYKENSKFGFKTTSGPIPFEGIETFESVAGGTKVNLAFHFEVGGFFRLAEPIVGRIAQRVVKADCRNLKDLLEAEG